MKSTARTLAVVIPLVWLGFILGISFLEAPLKFTAPGIDLKLGLGIGRIVFQALNKIELGFLIVLFGLYFFYTFSLRIRILHLILGSILLYQSAWLLPSLDIRAAQILNEITPEPSNLHIQYIALEIIKSVVLLISGIFSLSHGNRNIN